MRKNSSTALAISAGSARSSRCASGWRIRRSTPLPIRLVVVSCPALRMKMQLCRSSSSLSRSSAPAPANALAAISVERISLLELRHGRHPAGKLLGAEHRLERAEDCQRPAAQRRALVRRDAEHVADELDRDRGGKILDQVDRAAVDAAGERTVEQPVDQGLDAWLQRRERARREGGREKLAHPAVIGRIVEHQAGGVMLVQEAVAEVRPEVVRLVRAPGVGVAIDCGAIIIAAEEIRSVRHAMDRIVLAPRAVERARIGEEAGVEPLEVEGERGVAVGRNGCGRHAVLSPCGSARPSSAQDWRSAPS
jgi:hypothetical protein